MITVSPAEPRDAAAIAALLEDLGRFYGAAEPESLDRRPGRISTAQINEAIFGRGPAAHALLARDAAQVAGLAAYSFLWPAVGASRSLFLKELYVPEAYRRRGVGRLLMRAVFETAAAQGCSRVEWTTDAGNAAARAFYARLGLPERPSKVFYRVEDTGSGLRSRRLLRVTFIMVTDVTDTRNCEQCGTSFVPRREHARFCSARCRVAWNRQHVGDPPAEAGALGWTIGAMGDTVDRLLRARTSDQPHGFAAISEAVWWVTMVDATLVRYHPDVYDAALASHGPAHRQIIEGTFGGLRFVRNWMGYHLDHSDFIQPRCEHPIAAWTWRSLPEPVLAALSARGQEWEMTRYREYQARLAAKPIGETFGRAAAFLRLASDGSLSRG